MREIRYRTRLLENENDSSGLEFEVFTTGPSHKTQGYVLRKVNYHPFSNSRGYVLEHRLVMEERLGRFLFHDKEVVHHIDGNRENNNINNLKITSKVLHPAGHIGERNKHGQFIANDPIFQDIKIRLYNTNTKECRPYTLSELIGKTYRRGQFKFRGRFTGLHDKNGKEIYEGDVLSFTVFDAFDSDTQFKGVVVFAETRYMIWKSKDSEFYGSDGGFDLGFVHSQDCELEVIGNIYENPDLLGEGE
jgi:uncharacterized phage protein (TIGR01671 family)